MSKLTVYFLGTSSAAPTRDRSLPAIAIRKEGQILLLDCGEGVQRRFMEMGFGLNKEMAIFITHLHGDHVTGLLGLLQTMGLSQRTRPLDLVGPKKLLKWIEDTSKVIGMGLTFPVRFHEARKGIVFDSGDFQVRATKANHSVEAYSYLVIEKPRPGEFFPEKAKALGIPEGKLWSRLQRGRKITHAGKVVNPSEVTGPTRPGRRVGYSGDTRPTRALLRFFSGCDLLIFDSTFKASDEDRAVDRKHSTSVEAATLAKEAGAKRLALTHFSARYTNVGPLVKEARRVFPHSFAAHDGLKVDVDYES